MPAGARRLPAMLVPAVAALAMLALLVSLGVWQLGRAAEKRELVERFETRAAAAPLRLAPDAAADARGVEALRFRRVILEGRYLPQRQYLLDNRTHRGVAGYHVLTPLARGDAAPLILVDRGWLPVGESRAQLPDVAVSAAPVRLAATLAAPPRPGPLLGESGYEHGDWPRVVQYVDIEKIAAQLDARVLPLVARLDPGAPDGFVREWMPYYGISPERHLGYAVQWFALAVALAALCVYLALRRRARRDAD
ncbi:MAG: SURF1 family protein [Gammaproteobacteria bacterium]|nr:SURF1 family protein [Gammaproteobacteria bacterium]